MIEAMQVSLLSKAINFLFDEGQKIFQERRERRQKIGSKPVDSSKVENKNQENTSNINDTSKRKLLSSNINKDIWNADEEYIQHLMKLVEINLKKYYLAKEQYAKWGDALVPSIIVNNLEEAEIGLRETAQKLKDVLENVFGEKIELVLPID